MGFRRVARATAERSAIFSVLPESGPGDSVLLMLPQTSKPADTANLLSSLNSFAPDHVMSNCYGFANAPARCGSALRWARSRTRDRREHRAHGIRTGRPPEASSGARRRCLSTFGALHRIAQPAVGLTGNPRGCVLEASLPTLKGIGTSEPPSLSPRCLQLRRAIIGEEDAKP